MGFDNLNRKIGWVKSSAEEAGRNPEDIEFMIFVLEAFVTDDPEPIFKEQLKTMGLTMDDVDVEETPYLLVGDSSEIQKKIKRCRDKTGVSYFAYRGISLEQINQFSKSIIKPLNDY